LKTENKKWSDNHKVFKSAASDELIFERNVRFCKELFQSWDVDGDGTMDETELIKPLVTLGLAADQKSAHLIC